MPREQASRVPRSQKAEFDDLLRALIPILREYECRIGALGVIIDPPWNMPDRPGTVFEWSGEKWDEFPKPKSGL